MQSVHAVKGVMIGAGNVAPRREVFVWASAVNADRRIVGLYEEAYVHSEQRIGRRAG